MKTVAIIGGGVIGLTTGIVLLEAGEFDVTIYAEQIAGTSLNSNPLVSEVACALWLPMWTSDKNAVDENYPKQELQWSRSSFARFGKMPSASGVDSITNHEFYTETDIKSSLPLPKEVASIFAEFEEAHSGNFPPLPENMEPLIFRQSFRTFVISTPVYLHWLLNYFRSLGGRIAPAVKFHTQNEITSIKSDLIINSLGLASGDVFKDSALCGKKGQVLLFSPNAKIEASFGYGEYCMIPRRDALVFGSLCLDTYLDGQPTLDNTEHILSVVGPWFDWACSANPKTASNDFTTAAMTDFQQAAGLRPCRITGVRVQPEIINGARVIHNYGHAGAGFSLSWGTADEVLSISKNIF